MFRFLDSWVVEKTLFEFVNQGSCSCCSFSQSLKQEQLASLCSDWETDDQKKEKKSLWPQGMQEDVWAERVKYRRMLKEALPTYRERFVDGPDTEKFFDWLYALDTASKKQIFQMPTEQMSEYFTTNFKHAYQVVLSAVLQQVVNYADTGYSNDGATVAEVTFEECVYSERGAIVIETDFYETDEGIEVLIERCRELGGAHLLPKRDDERRTAAEHADAAEESKESQSFRADRRLIRVSICRYYADVAWRKFQRTNGATAAKVAVVSTTSRNTATKESE
jgi:hypothetical protein